MMKISRCLLLGLVAANIFALTMGYEGPFEAYDTDNNRKITRSEVTTFFKSNCELDATTAQLDAMFKAADKDSSGDVVIGEFPAFEDHNYNNLYKKCFEYADTDDDSYLTFEETLAFLRKWSGASTTTTDEEFKKLFDRGDADNNNKLDYTEVKNEIIMF